MSETTVFISSSNEPGEDRQYQAFLRDLQRTYAEHANDFLFTTNATGLFDAFLDGLPSDRRQHYNCNACRRFVDRFGALVAINENGEASSLLWSVTPQPFFQRSVYAMHRIVARAAIDGVFITSDRVMGLPRNKSVKPPGEWHHMHLVTATEQAAGRHWVADGADQEMAERKERHGVLSRGLDEFTEDHVRQVHTWLSTGQLPRSEKHAALAEWLLKLHEARNATKNKKTRDALVWRAVAGAPVGWSNFKNGAIGKLLEDTKAGLSFEQIRANHAAVMDPLAYLRPQAAPSEGAIAAAEKVVSELRAAGALRRRFARLDEVQALWKPKPSSNGSSEPSGVFGHLRADKPAASASTLAGAPVVMTWEKFQRTVIPAADTIEFWCANERQNFAHLVTAVDPDAPPILQWDREDRRNPVSWYLYSAGTLPAEIGARANAWVPVSAVTYQPSMWHGSNEHSGKGVIFLLQDTKDLRANPSSPFSSPGLGLFPEILRKEFHPIRSVIEAHSNKGKLEGFEQASATGITLQSGGKWRARFRVTSGKTQVVYELDRWD